MEYVKGLVRELKERFGTGDPFELCDYLDILVLTMDLPASVKGFYCCAGGFKIIYLSDRLAQNERALICAHELGHAVLHEHVNGIFITVATFMVPSRFEREADLFAAHLLLDDGRVMYDRYGLSTVEQIAMHTGIDERIVRMRYL